MFISMRSLLLTSLLTLVHSSALQPRQRFGIGADVTHEGRQLNWNGVIPGMKLTFEVDVVDERPENANKTVSIALARNDNYQPGDLRWHPTFVAWLFTGMSKVSEKNWTVTAEPYKNESTPSQETVYYSQQFMEPNMALRVPLDLKANVTYTFMFLYESNMAYSVGPYRIRDTLEDDVPSPTPSSVATSTGGAKSSNTTGNEGAAVGSIVSRETMLLGGIAAIMSVMCLL